MIWLTSVLLASSLQLTFQIICENYPLDYDDPTEQSKFCEANLCYYAKFEGEELGRAGCMKGYDAYMEPSCIRSSEVETAQINASYVCFCNHSYYCNACAPAFSDYHDSIHIATLCYGALPLIVRQETVQCLSKDYIIHESITEKTMNITTLSDRGTTIGSICQLTGYSHFTNNVWTTVLIASAVPLNSSDTFFRFEEAIYSKSLSLYEGGIYGFQTTPTTRNLTMLCGWSTCNEYKENLFTTGSVNCILKEHRNKPYFTETSCKGQLCVLFYDHKRDEYLSACMWQYNNYSLGRFEVGEYSLGDYYTAIICAEDNCNADLDTANSSAQNYIPEWEPFIPFNISFDVAQPPITTTQPTTDATGKLMSAPTVYLMIIIALNFFSSSFNCDF